MPRVLIVEDDESSRESLRAALEDAGYAVVVAADGEAALALYLEADVVVTDLVMEPIDGLQLIEKLRRGSPQLQTILVTAHANAAVERRARRAGAFALLPKPIDLDALERALQAALAS